MTKEERDRAEARTHKAATAAQDAKAGKTDRDAANKAVLDNMARLKALRLAKEAAEPARPAATIKKAASKIGKKTHADKSPALSAWLAGQKSGGHRT